MTSAGPTGTMKPAQTFFSKTWSLLWKLQVFNDDRKVSMIPSTNADSLHWAKPGFEQGSAPCGLSPLLPTSDSRNRVSRNLGAVTVAETWRNR
eukprot:7383829-Prymnesium_polylepis.1